MMWLCILASMIWGANIVFMKTLLSSQPALTVAFWRVLFSAAVLGIMGKIYHCSFRVQVCELTKLSWLGLLNVAFNFSLSFMGMTFLQGTSVAMLNALSPVIIALLAWTFERQRPDLKKTLALICTLIGVGCSFRFAWNTLSIGHLLLVLSLVCYSSSFLIAKNLRLNNMMKSFYTLLLGGLMLGVFLFLKGELAFLDMNIGQWGLFIAISVIGFAYIQWTYFTASEKIGMKKTSFYMNFNPLFTYLGSVLFLAEPLSLHEVTAMIWILLGLWLSRKEKESERLS